MKKETLQRHLKRFNACLHEQKREDGTKYTSFKLKAITGENKTLKPYQKVLSDAIYKQNSITTNFDYEQASQLITHLIEADFDDLDELEEKAPYLIHEWADADVDIYTKDLTEWLNENVENVYYLTEAINEYNANDGFNALTMAQYCAIRDIYNNVLDKIIDYLKTL